MSTKSKIESTNSTTETLNSRAITGAKVAKIALASGLGLSFAAIVAGGVGAVESFATGHAAKGVETNFEHVTTDIIAPLGVIGGLGSGLGLGIVALATGASARREIEPGINGSGLPGPAELPAISTPASVDPVSRVQPH